MTGILVNLVHLEVAVASLGGDITYNSKVTLLVNDILDGIVPSEHGGIPIRHTDISFLSQLPLVLIIASEGSLQVLHVNSAFLDISPSGQIIVSLELDILQANIFIALLLTVDVQSIVWAF